MRKIILHVGSGKTGSTSIQRALCECRHKNEPIFSFPKLLEWKNNQVFRFAFCDSSDTPSNIRNKYRDKPKEYKEFQNSIKNSFVKETMGRQLVVVSSEFLFLSSKEEVMKVNKFLVELGFEEIHVVMYLRDPAKYYLSVAQQALKNQHKLPRPDRFRYELCGAIDNWSSLKPKSLTVKEFDRKQLVNQDVVKDMESYISNIFNKPIYLELIKQQNETMSVEGTVILQEFHKVLVKSKLSEIERAELIKAARSFSIRANAGNRPILKKDIEEYIYKKFHDEIIYLYKEFKLFERIAMNNFNHVELEKYNDFIDIVDNFNIYDYLELKKSLSVLN